ncbi:Aste57867_1196 [Aphanomyces stellatus]|uniref:Aste57867_1196 protein n=1 Tax=Aphanomyces stellatus TaxID=120398 RepID=A0A485K9Q2_9STRA|nr:hypothetical protein As57867_001195 [Aphanomyces stellatus]VFT78416.1 Aste57867_1196 [Aphanomyces stellatus]
MTKASRKSSTKDAPTEASAEPVETRPVDGGPPHASSHASSVVLPPPPTAGTSGQLFPPIPIESYVHCLARHAALVAAFPLTASVLEVDMRQHMTNVLAEILDTTAASPDPLAASMTAVPSLRFVLRYLLYQEQSVWPQQEATPELVVGFSGVHVMLWRITRRVDALVAAAASHVEMDALDDLNAHLKLRLALLTECWSSAVTSTIETVWQADRDKAKTQYVNLLLQGLLRPMANFLLTVDDQTARVFLLTNLIDKTIDTTIETLVATVLKVTETDRRTLQRNIEELKVWIDSVHAPLSALASVKRLDRLFQEWSILGVDHKSRRSSFDVILDTLTADSIAKFYRHKSGAAMAVSMRHLSSKSPRK